MPKYTVCFPVFVTASAKVDAQDADEAIEKAEPGTGLCWQCSRVLDVGEVDWERPHVIDEDGNTLITDGKPVKEGDDA